MKKTPYKRNTVVLNLKEDLQLRHDIDVEFWEDPSQQVVFDLLGIVTLSYNEGEELDKEQELEITKLNDRYFECASLILVDCNIEGIDFSTPQSAEEAFYDERVSWGVFHQALIAYLARLMDEYGMLKKALRRLRDQLNSGTESETKKD
jgi:hypothetical protein